MENVHKLFEQKSKWDVVVKGRTIRLVIDPCSCGVHAKWVIEAEVPEFIKPMLGNQKPERIIDEWHWHPTWKDKVLFRKLEPELIKWIKKTRKRLEEVQKAEDDAEKLRQLVEEVNV